MITKTSEEQQEFKNQERRKQMDSNGFTIYREKELQADLLRLSEVSDFVKEILISAGCDRSFCAKIDIVVEEVYANIASYAYQEAQEEKPVWVECGAKDDCIYLVFKDKGSAYNPLMTDDPVTGDAENMTIGGYGIYMVKTIADEVEYKYDRVEGINILTIRKKYR